MKLRPPLKSGVVQGLAHDGGGSWAVALYDGMGDQILVISDPAGGAIETPILAFKAANAWRLENQGSWPDKPSDAPAPPRIVLASPDGWMEMFPFTAGKTGQEPFDQAAELADRNILVCSRDHVWITAPPLPDGAIAILSCEDEVEAGLVCEYSTSWVRGTKGNPDRRVPDTLKGGKMIMDEKDLGPFAERAQVILHRIRTRRTDGADPRTGKGLMV